MRAVSRPLIGLLLLLFVAWLALFGVTKVRLEDERTAHLTEPRAPYATTTWPLEGRPMTTGEPRPAHTPPPRSSRAATTPTQPAEAPAAPPRDPDGMNPRNAAGAILFLLILFAATGGGKKK